MIHEIHLLLQERWFYQLKHISFLFALILSDLSRRITFQYDIHGLMLDKGKVLEPLQSDSPICRVTFLLSRNGKVIEASDFKTCKYIPSASKSLGRRMC